MPLQSGELFQDRYEILSCLNRGGMGAVYKARDTRLQHGLVAIKELLDPDSDYIRQKFDDEMATLARLEHPAIPRIRDFFAVESRRYIVMDFVAGRDLAAELAANLEITGEPCDPAVVVADALTVLDVLSYLHTQKPAVIHRDIKPANLIREEKSGRIKVVDFGLARQLEADERSQTMVGTIGYCAPEQMVGRAETASDLYALGATMQHLITGEPPGVRLQKPEGVKPGLVELIERATAVSPRDRFESAAAMKSKLERWLRSETGLTPAAAAGGPGLTPGELVATVRAEAKGQPLGRLIPALLLIFLATVWPGWGAVLLVPLLGWFASMVGPRAVPAWERAVLARGSKGLGLLCVGYAPLFATLQLWAAVQARLSATLAPNEPAPGWYPVFALGCLSFGLLALMVATWNLPSAWIALQERGLRVGLWALGQVPRYTLPTALLFFLAGAWWLTWATPLELPQALRAGLRFALATLYFFSLAAWHRQGVDLSPRHGA